MKEGMQPFHQATTSRSFWKGHHKVLLLHTHGSLLQTKHKASFLFSTNPFLKHCAYNTSMKNIQVLNTVSSTETTVGLYKTINVWNTNTSCTFNSVLGQTTIIKSENPFFKYVYLWEIEIFRHPTNQLTKMLITFVFI